MGREKISKSIRFEVMKRDKFTCQYCGKSAPDVILEIDHIVPVTKGGDNTILNLITSCRDCNRGKSDKELSDDTAVKKQKKQLDDLADRREQIEMMVEWRKELAQVVEQEIDEVEDVFRAYTEWTFTPRGRLSVKKLIERFGISEVLEAAEIAIGRYYYGTLSSWIETFNKIGGICYNRKKKREADAEQDY